jgi:hypothetical protein
MPFNLNDFRTSFVHGGARPSQFEMQIFGQMPCVAPQEFRRQNATSAFLCHMSQIPA